MFEIRKLELRTVLTPISFHSPGIHLSYFQLLSVPPTFSLFFLSSSFSCSPHRQTNYRMRSGKRRKLNWYKNSRTNSSACAVNMSLNWKNNKHRWSETWLLECRASYRGQEVGGTRNSNYPGTIIRDLLNASQSIDELLSVHSSSQFVHETGIEYSVLFQGITLSFSELLTRGPFLESSQNISGPKSHS